MTTTPTSSGTVLFAYDGSDLAKGAIAEAGRQLDTNRDALVLTVWQPYDLGFAALSQAPLDAVATDPFSDAAETAAAEGASLAKAAGFNATSIVAESAPIWKGIVEAAEEHHASLIVLGSHGRTGLAEVVLGSVAQAVAAHSPTAVLIVHRPGSAVGDEQPSGGLSAAPS